MLAVKGKLALTEKIPDMMINQENNSDVGQQSGLKQIIMTMVVQLNI